MCFGIPGKIVKIKGKKAKIKQDKHYHWVDISVVDQKLGLGDYLICYQKMAINKISAKDAREILSLIQDK